MGKISIKNVSALEKIMPEMICREPSFNSGSALIDELFSYQIAVKGCEDIHGSKQVSLEVCSEIANCITLYNVRCVPVLMPHFWDEPDENYILEGTGLVPDILEPFTGLISVTSHNYCAVWVDVKVNDKVQPGVHNIKIIFKDADNGELLGESNFELEVIGAKLPKLDIPYTNWMHCDCISSYYGCEELSERHWELIDNFMGVAAENGVNMMLTPIFTPALDTKIGAERPTVQLVDVFCSGGKYSFDFEKLLRWFDLCKKHGIEYIELAHLYTQWGAEHTPKIEVTENGIKTKKFGWHTESMGEEYKEFIAQFIPELKRVLCENWDKEKVYFHISDEPAEQHIEFYGEIYKFIKPLLGEFKQMDAISDYEIFEKGYIETPVVATTSINDFLDKNIENLWAYYCCGQGKFNLSNRFIAMTSQRNRIMGLQLYKNNIKGFLQWGYNFYYSQRSTYLINPYLVNDADGAFGAGDAFGVYPGSNGAVESLRIKVFKHGLQDMMALKTLESYIGREKTMELITEVEAFRTYPSDAEYILNVRKKVNELIKANI